MTESNRLVELSLLAGAVIVAVAVAQLREKRKTVDATAQQIQDQIDALDPVARRAVIARLTIEAAKDVKAHLGRS